jgi:3'(2'), 5'-bisphosphate nucleotidase
MKHHDYLELCLTAVWEACRCCEEIAAAFDCNDTHQKEDRSPVTIADYASQALILWHLAKLTPGIGVVAEEGADALREQPEMVERIASFTTRQNPQVNADNLLDLLDRGNHPGGEGTFWTLDPIDGTKGFLRGGQYAVALALIGNGAPLLGVLGCPRYELEDGKTGVVFSGGVGVDPQARLTEGEPPRSIRTCAEIDLAEARLCESVESAHTAHDRSSELIKTLGISQEVLRLDSQAKYACVAHGAAALYLRLPVKKGYQEKIWDHAAGVAVIEAAGGRVTDLKGQPLDFSQGQTLAHNEGVIATNGPLHHAALATVMAQRSSNS